MMVMKQHTLMSLYVLNNNKHDTNNRKRLTR